MSKIFELDEEDYKNIFIDIANKLYGKNFIDDKDRVELIGIINRDNNLLKPIP